MDLGAHFYCCDLQVHSPRDRNWEGPCPTDDQSRKTFSEGLVARCRVLGLQAIAVTDHHDVAFFPYIREAAQTERDDKNEEIPPERKLIVFPGTELTLSLPCQALLIFDPDVDPASLIAALSALGIQPSPPGDAKTAETEKLRFTSMQQVCDSLDALPSIEGRYILLPNVNDGGNDSILRHDFCKHYKDMPCVGGYVDGDFHGHGKKLIVDGKDPEWGNKRIGVIQTSDSRRADFSKLGAHSTWIKWSKPCTEAIRQACLSPASRVRYKTPVIPENWVASIAVSDSKYFGGFTVEFNPQFNAIIGGRGSGKSTILEYLRWALCDQAYVHSGDDSSELPNFEMRRRALVARTLETTLGNVTVTYIRNGVQHVVRREAGTNRVYLKIGDDQEQETNEDVIQSLAQIQGYSQKQLSHVSARTQELERLLTAPVAQLLSNLEAEIEGHASALRQAFERSESKRALQDQLQSIELDIASKKQQHASLSEDVKDLPPEQWAEIEAQPFFGDGERIASAFKSSITAASSTLTSVESSLRRAISDLPQVGTARPQVELKDLREKIAVRFKHIAEQLHELSGDLANLQTNLRVEFQNVDAQLAEHKSAYDKAASENQVIQTRLATLKVLSTQILTAESDRDSFTSKLNGLGDVDADLLATRNSWLESLSRK